MAGTTWNVFQDATKAKATDVNENFDWIEGALMPHNAGVMTSGAYDIGSSTKRFNTGYFRTSIILGGVEISGPADNVTVNVSGSFAMGIASGGARGSTANSGGSQQEILQGSISTPDFRADAVTQIGMTSNSSEIGTNTIASVSITTTGGKVLVLAHMTVQLMCGGFGVSQLDCSVGRDTTVLTGTRLGRTTAASTTSIFPAAFCFMDTPSAGSHTYHLAYAVTTGSLTSISNYAITVVEIKK